VLTEWIDHCLDLSEQPADFYSGCRKIRRLVRLQFDKPRSQRLKLVDCGFTTNKMRYLERNYLHEESISTAVMLWDRRREQAKYGSVGFTTYNHFLKNDPDKKSKRASVMGPCIQSLTLTWLAKDRVAIDAFYRTTELLKKFPADLCFIRDKLLPRFNLEDMDIELNCHFANVTIHPMYFVTILPHLDDPVDSLSRLKASDEYFHNWVVKWTARYLCPEFHRGIAKFAQALRTQKDGLERIDPELLPDIQKYLRDNHPGYRNDATPADDEEDEE
jgi:hypothetical protein